MLASNGALRSVYQYFVLDRIGRDLVMAEGHNPVRDRAELIELLMRRGEFDRPARILALNFVDGCAFDLSEETAGELVDHVAETDAELPEPTRRFCNQFVEVRKRLRALERAGRRMSKRIGTKTESREEIRIAA
jgi:hypothetical protein